MSKSPHKQLFSGSFLLRGEPIVLIISLLLWCLPSTRLFLWKMGESNLFLLNRTYFESTFYALGGPLDYLSHALTAFLSSPWTGLPSITCTWLLLTLLVSRATQLKGAWAWLNILPGFWALALAAHMGFGIWVTPLPHFVFQILLGLFITVATFLVVERRPIGYALIPLLPLYLACGGWVFLFALLVFIRRLVPAEIRPMTPAYRLTGLIPLLLFLPMPYLLIRLDLLHVSPLTAYLTHLLLFKGNNGTWNMIFVGLFLTLPVLILLKPIVGERRWPPVIALLACGFIFFLCAEKNPQLGILLSVEIATKEGRWTDILLINRDLDRPHRMLAAYRILALHKTQRIAHDLFQYPVQTTHLKTSVDTLKLNGPLLLYEYGLVLNARKAVMEDVVDYGYSPERLRLLGMISCAAREYGAAYTYFDKLAHQPFYRGEAERWLRILQGKEKPPRDFEHVASTYSVFKKTDARGIMGPNNRLEEDIYTSYQIVKDCPTGMAIFYLMITLLEKTPSKLALNLESLKQLQTNGELPAALQEGLLFHFATTLPQEKRDQLNFNSYGISEATQERWNAFLSLHEKWASHPKQLQSEMKKTFGRTYWYYHLFTP